jgi:hypothetical protein
MAHEVAITIRWRSVSGELRQPAPPGLSDTKSQRNYNRDMYECEREAIFAGRDNKQQVFDSCMKTRGYIPSSTDRPEWPHTQ